MPFQTTRLRRTASDESIAPKFATEDAALTGVSRHLTREMNKADKRVSLIGSESVYQLQSLASPTDTEATLWRTSIQKGHSATRSDVTETSVRYSDKRYSGYSAVSEDEPDWFVDAGETEQDDQVRLLLVKNKSLEERLAFFERQEEVRLRNVDNLSEHSSGTVDVETVETVETTVENTATNATNTAVQNTTTTIDTTRPIATVQLPPFDNTAPFRVPFTRTNRPVQTDRAVEEVQHPRKIRDIPPLDYTFDPAHTIKITEISPDGNQREFTAPVESEVPYRRSATAYYARVAAMEAAPGAPFTTPVSAAPVATTNTAPNTSTSANTTMNDLDSSPRVSSNQSSLSNAPVTASHASPDTIAAPVYTSMIPPVETPANTPMDIPAPALVAAPVAAPTAGPIRSAVRSVSAPILAVNPFTDAASIGSDASVSDASTQVGHSSDQVISNVIQTEFSHPGNRSAVHFEPSDPSEAFLAHFGLPEESGMVTDEAFMAQIDPGEGSSRDVSMRSPRDESAEAFEALTEAFESLNGPKEDPNSVFEPAESSITRSEASMTLSEVLGAGEEDAAAFEELPETQEGMCGDFGPPSEVEEDHYDSSDEEGAFSDASELPEGFDEVDRRGSETAAASGDLSEPVEAPSEVPEAKSDAPKSSNFSKPLDYPPFEPTEEQKRLYDPIRAGEGFRDPSYESSTEDDDDLIEIHGEPRPVSELLRRGRSGQSWSSDSSSESSRSPPAVPDSSLASLVGRASREPSPPLPIRNQSRVVSNSSEQTYVDDPEQQTENAELAVEQQADKEPEMSVQQQTDKELMLKVKMRSFSGSMLERDARDFVREFAYVVERTVGKNIGTIDFNHVYTAFDFLLKDCPIPAPYLVGCWAALKDWFISEYTVFASDSMHRNYIMGQISRRCIYNGAVFPYLSEIMSLTYKTVEFTSEEKENIYATLLHHVPKEFHHLIVQQEVISQTVDNLYRGLKKAKIVRAVSRVSAVPPPSDFSLVPVHSGYDSDNSEAPSIRHKESRAMLYGYRAGTNQRGSMNVNGDLTITIQVAPRSAG